ncbi:Allene oxide cyclase [Klebsormidium nitens]|uniref:Dirigent protein n=1 Tax=Klebsormidium nitens TaxID=105231 RepID=A0A1Y1I8D4_KLENI|nr:Allene oxide cyclase [Klebsormidium nitens]|eukprot:GAQ86793.1 Allene oxide cyclase [Klebsormidium nitens]
MLALTTHLLASVCASARSSARADGFEKKPEYKEFRLQLREFATPETQQSNGTNFGDIVWFNDRVEDFNTGERFGFVQGICTFTQSLDPVTGSYKIECEFSFIHKEGSFTVTGLSANTPTDLAVVGGTGIYTGATGVARQSTLSDNGQGFFTFGYNIKFFAIREIRLEALKPKA